MVASFHCKPDPKIDLDRPPVVVDAIKGWTRSTAIRSNILELRGHGKSTLELQRQRCHERGRPLPAWTSLLAAANSDKPLPHKILPTQPAPTDPFAYPDPAKK